MSLVCRALLTIFIIFGVVSVVLSLVHTINYLALIQYISYIKLAITLVKYVPQVRRIMFTKNYDSFTGAHSLKAFMNYKRKSTVGWSIGNVLLDLTGGVMSILQMMLIAYNTGTAHMSSAIS